MNIPDVLDYLPIERVVMCGLIIAFSSVQISLALHNETLREAIRAHREFIRNNLGRFGWFLLICGDPLFLPDHRGRDRPRRDCRSRARDDLWKSIFVCAARLGHRLAARFVGLSVSARRDRATGSTSRPGSNISDEP